MNDGALFFGDDESAGATIENGANINNSDDGDLAVAGGLEGGSGHSATVNVGSNVQLDGNVGGVGIRNPARTGEAVTSNATLTYNGNGSDTSVQGGSLSVVLQNTSGAVNFNNSGDDNLYFATNSSVDPNDDPIMGVGAITSSGTASFNNSGSGLFIFGNDLGLIVVSENGNANFDNTGSAIFGADVFAPGSVGATISSTGGTADYDNSGSVIANGAKSGLIVTVSGGSGNADYNSSDSTTATSSEDGGVALGVIVRAGSGDALYNSSGFTTATSSGTGATGIAVLNVDDDQNNVNGSGDARYTSSAFADVSADAEGSVGIAVISAHGTASYSNNGGTAQIEGGKAGITVVASEAGGGASYFSSGSTTASSNDTKGGAIIVNVSGGAGNASYTSSASTTATANGTDSVGISVIAADSSDPLPLSTGNASYTSSGFTDVTATNAGSAGIVVSSARGTASYNNNGGATAQIDGAKGGIIVSVTTAGGAASYGNTGTTTVTANEAEGAGILVTVAGGASDASYNSSGATTVTATGINSTGIGIIARDDTGLPSSTGDASYISSAFTDVTATAAGSAGIAVSSVGGSASYQNNNGATAQVDGAKTGIAVAVTGAGGNASYFNTGTTTATANETGAGIVVTVSGGTGDVSYTSSGATTVTATGIDSTGIGVIARDADGLPDSSGDASYVSSAFTDVSATASGSAGIAVSSVRGSASYQNNNGATAQVDGAKTGLAVAVTGAGGNASYSNTGTTTATANETGAGIVVTVSGGTGDVSYTSSGATTVTATGIDSTGIGVLARDADGLPDSTGDASYVSSAFTDVSATAGGSVAIAVTSARGTASYENNGSAQATARGAKAGITVIVSDAGGNASYSNTGNTLASASDTKGAGIVVNSSGGAGGAFYSSSGATTATATGTSSTGIAIIASDNTDPLLPPSTGDASYVSSALADVSATAAGSAGIVVSSARGSASYTNDGGTAQVDGAKTGIAVAVSDAGGPASYLSSGATTITTNETKGAGVAVTVSGGASNASYTSSALTDVTVTGTSSVGIAVLATDSDDLLLPPSTGNASYFSSALTEINATSTGSAGITIFADRGAASYTNAFVGGTTTINADAAGVLVSVQDASSIADASYLSTGATQIALAAADSAGVSVIAQAGDANYDSQALADISAGKVGIIVTTEAGAGGANYSSSATALVSASGVDSNGVVVFSSGGSASYASTGIGTEISGVNSAVSVAGQTGLTSYNSVGATLTGVENGLLVANEFGNVSVTSNDVILGTAGAGATIAKSGIEGSVVATFNGSVTAQGGDGLTVAATTSNPYEASTLPAPGPTTVDLTMNGTVQATGTGIKAVATSNADAGFSSGDTAVTAVLSATSSVQADGTEPDDAGVVVGSTSATGTADATLTLEAGDGVTTGIVRSAATGILALGSSNVGGTTEVDIFGNVISGGNGLVAVRQGSFGDVDVLLGATSVIDAGGNGVVASHEGTGGVVNVLSDARIIADQSGLLASNSGGAATVVTNGEITAAGPFGAAVNIQNGDGFLQVNSAINGGADTGAGVIIQGNGNATLDINASVEATVTGATVNSIGGTGSIDIDIDGRISSDGVGVAAVKNGDGDTSINVTEAIGGLSSEATGSTGIQFTGINGDGDVSILTSLRGTINAAGAGISVSKTLSDGNVTVTTNGAIEAGASGIAVSHQRGNGRVRVVANEEITAGANGIDIRKATSSGNIDVTTNALITAGETGILVEKTNGSGDVTVTATQSIVAGQSGIDVTSTGGTGRVDISFAAFQSIDAAVNAISAGNGNDVDILVGDQARLNAGFDGIFANGDGVAINLGSEVVLNAGHNGIDAGGEGGLAINLGADIVLNAGHHGIFASNAASNDGISIEIGPRLDLQAGYYGIWAINSSGTSGIAIDIGEQAKLVAGNTGLLADNSGGTGSVVITAGDELDLNAGYIGVAAYNRGNAGDVTIQLGASSSVVGGRRGIEASTTGDVLIDIGQGSFIAGNVSEHNGQAINVFGPTNTVINLGANSTVLGAGSASIDAVVMMATSGSSMFNIASGSLVSSWSYFRRSPVAAASDYAITADGGVSTINNYGTVYGLVALSGQDDVFNNFSSNSWITVGTSLFRSGNDVVNNIGRTVTALQGGLDESTTFQWLETFRNGDAAGIEAGTLTMLDGDTLGMNSGRDITYTYGIFEGVTAGPLGARGNSRLEVDAYLGGPGTTSDRLVIGGLDVNVNPVSSSTLVSPGQTEIFVADVNANGVGAFNPQGVLVVDLYSGMTIGKNDPAGLVPSFVIAPDSPNYDPKFGGVLEKGLFFYDILVGSLDGGPANDVFFVGVPDHEVFELPVFVTAAQNIWYDTSGLWLDRQADLRSVLFAGASAPAGVIVSKENGVIPAATRPVIDGPGMWGKALGSWTARDTSSTFQIMNGTYTYDTSTHQDTYGFIGGIDFGRTTDDATWIVGVLGGYISSNLSFDAAPTSGSYDGGTVGVYATYIKGGFFVDVLAKADILDLDYSVPTLSNIAYTGETVDSNTYGFTIDTGYRFETANRTFVEPVATFSYVSVDLGNLTKITDTNVAFDGESARGSIGVRGGAVVADAETYWVELSGTLRAWYEFDGDNTALIINPGTPFTAVDDFSGGFGEVTGSINWFGRNNGFSAFANGGLKFNDDYRSSSLRVGLRYQW